MKNVRHIALFLMPFFCFLLSASEEALKQSDQSSPSAAAKPVSFKKRFIADATKKSDVPSPVSQQTKSPQSVSLVQRIMQAFMQNTDEQSLETTIASRLSALKPEKLEEISLQLVTDFKAAYMQRKAIQTELMSLAHTIEADQARDAALSLEHDRLVKAIELLKATVTTPAKESQEKPQVRKKRKGEEERSMKLSKGTEGLTNQNSSDNQEGS